MISNARDLVAVALPFLHAHEVCFENRAPSAIFATRLCDSKDDAARTLIEEQCEFRNIPFGLVGGSLAFQRYSHRICALAVACFLLEDALPNLRVSNVSLTTKNGVPKTLWLADDAVITSPSLDDVTDMVMDQHLLPIADAFHELTGVGIRNLHGNIAASFALGIRKVADEVGREKAKSRGEELLESRRELKGLGEFEIVEAHGKSRLFFHRRSCCHLYEARGGKYCAWCSKRTNEDRLRMFANQMKR